MSEPNASSERETRMRVFSANQKIFASAPIRLMSRTVAEMRAQGYNDTATAIGDMDWRTVPANDPEDPELRQDWGRLLDTAFANIPSYLDALGPQPMGYNLSSVGYSAVTRAWGGLWSHQLGLDFENRPQAMPEIFVFHGGNQAVQAAFFGLLEAHRVRCGARKPCIVLAPVPTFPCPLDQLALLGVDVHLLPPSRAGMDPSPADLAQVPDDVEVDGLYMMPINNPTGRTVEPEVTRAFVDAALARWPHAGVLLDSVYVRIHPRYREILAWYAADDRYSESVIFTDSLSKTHGVTGLRAGALLTRSARFAVGVSRFAQNVVAGPSNAMQAVVLSLLEPFASGDKEMAERRIQLQLRIGRHMQRRRRLCLREAFSRYERLLDDRQPILPDPESYDWEGSMYAVVRLSERCIEAAARSGLSPTVELYLETGLGGVPLEGFCQNANLDRHGLMVNGGDQHLQAFVRGARNYVRLAFGMVSPPEG